jgi:hypothetical protein
MSQLLGELRKAGAHNQVEVLINRLPAAGVFSLYCELEKGRKKRFRFGCNTARDSPSVQPAPPWHWQDLA